MGPTWGVPFAAVHPVYVGWTQLAPSLKENEIPDVPTPGVNGHGDSSVANTVVPHGAMSISSFAPAASVLGRDASIATAGSFCLFRGNGVVGLPTVTRASVAAAAATAKTSAMSPRTATVQPRRAEILTFLISNPLFAYEHARSPPRGRRRRFVLSPY